MVGMHGRRCMDGIHLLVRWYALSFGEDTPDEKAATRKQRRKSDKSVVASRDCHTGHCEERACQRLTSRAARECMQQPQGRRDGMKNGMARVDLLRPQRECSLKQLLAAGDNLSNVAFTSGHENPPVESTRKMKMNVSFAPGHERVGIDQGEIASEPKDLLFIASTKFA